MWSVASEGLEYADPRDPHGRLRCLAFVGVGGTGGGVLGSLLTACYATRIHFAGLMVGCAALLEVSARLAEVMGEEMKWEWTRKPKVRSSGDLRSLDVSLQVRYTYMPTWLKLNDREKWGG